MAVGAVSILSRISESTPSPTTVSFDNAIMHPSPLASHPFRIPTPNFSDLDIPSELQYSSPTASAANVAGTRTSYLGGDLADALGHAHRLKNRHSRDDVASLIEFLRTHEPPPDNFMSRPYSPDPDDSERGRWAKLKVRASRKRSKSMSRVPAPIRLPDSAVAGVTTCGHRHIAISIPLDAIPSQVSPLGAHTPTSPGIAYNDNEYGNGRLLDRPVPPLPGPVRSFTNDKGVVTVLRPHSNDYYPYTTPSSPSSRRYDRDTPPQLLRNRRIVAPSSPPLSPDSLPSWPLASPDMDNQSASPLSSPSLDSADSSRPLTGSFAYRPAETVRTAYPSRGSSIASPPRAKHQHTSSIDQVITQEEPYVRNPSPIPRPGVIRRNTDRRPAHPPVSLATLPLARKSASCLRSDWQADRNRPISHSLKVAPGLDSPIINRDGESPSPPPSAASVKNRREKVRDMKLRDLAASRGTNKLANKLANKTALAARTNSREELGQLSDINGGATDSVAASNKIGSGPKLSTIMVVMDMKPDGDEDGEEKTAVKSGNGKAEFVVDKFRKPSDVQASRSLVCRGNPTPPASTETSPSQQYEFDTRTCLTRRREWQGNRELRRKKSAPATMAKAHLRQLAASGTRSGGVKGDTMDVTDPEKEIFRLYEAYREQRFRDMEGRLRRLERNGDVWLRALGPVLQDMDDTSGGAGRDGGVKDASAERERTRDWVSDEETAAGSVEQLDRLTQRRKLARRASLSRERVLEELMRRQERGERAVSDREEEEGVRGEERDGRSSASWVGSLEPVMRELSRRKSGTEVRRASLRVR